MLSDLIVAIDLSEDGPKVVALVGIKEHVLKDQRFSTIASTLKHFRRIPSRNKHTYINAFTRRYAKLYSHIALAKVYIYEPRIDNELDTLLHRVQPSLVLIDDKLYGTITYPKKLHEGRVRKKHHRCLMTIADNLANYFRILLKKAPKRFREELRKFEK